MSVPACDERHAVGERRALLAVAGDAVDLAGMGDAVVAGDLGRQRDDDHGVVGLGGVVEVLEVGVDLAEAGDEVRR